MGGVGLERRDGRICCVHTFWVNKGFIILCPGGGALTGTEWMNVLSLPRLDVAFGVDSDMVCNSS